MGRFILGGFNSPLSKGFLNGTTLMSFYGGSMINLPGLKGTGERKTGGIVLRPGRYVMEIVEWKAYESPKSPTLVNLIKMLILEGIGSAEVQDDGRDSKGIKFTYMITTPTMDNPDYNEWWAEASREELDQLLVAAGVIADGGQVDEQMAVGKTVIVDMVPEKQKNGDVRNKAQKWAPDVVK